MSHSSVQRYMAELLATYLLLFFGAGVVVASEFHAAQANLTLISLTWGIVVGLLVYGFGPISGAHMNPSVTVSLWLFRKFSGKDVIPYLAMQALGSVLAILTLKALFFPEGGMSATLFCSTHPSGSVSQSFVFEVIMTGFLLFTVMALGAAKATQGQAAMAVAAVVTLLVFVGGPISGASLNPARSLGPALVSGNLAHLWIYLTAPVLGGIVGVFMHTVIFKMQSAMECDQAVQAALEAEEISVVAKL